MKKILGIVLCVAMLVIITGCNNEEVGVKELNKINDKITEFYINNNDTAGNLGSHYVDEENKVVVVELINNSKEEQEKFRKEVIDSEYIKFVQGSQQDNHQIKITKTKDCDNQVIEYYQYEEQKVYLVCLDEITIDGATFKDYFSKTYQTFNDSIDNLTKNMEVIDTYKDGGTKLYKNHSIALIKCNTIDGNKDIYIGDTNLEYQESFCK